jgi:hypothetical protein
MRPLHHSSIPRAEACAMQMETAALKAASDTRSRVFEREVTAVYTPATLEAGTCDDVGGEVAGDSVATAAASSFLLSVAKRNTGALY